jgi:citrate synthase
MADASDLRAAALRAVAAFPTLVAAYWRLRSGQQAIAPRDDLGHAANYLYMLTGALPTEAQVRALNTYLNTVLDHGLNASTFTARVIISTQSDMISAVVGAVGALKGPLHGGAPGPALDMVFEIGTPQQAEAVIQARLDRGERLMGFGHRVYRVRDPRADVLNEAAARFYEHGDQSDVYALARHVGQVALGLLRQHRPERKLETNVEFYTALVLHGLGLPTDLFSPTRAIARVGGWTAYAFEQLETKRVVRPASAYTGVKDRAWIPIEARGSRSQ